MNYQHKQLCRHNRDGGYAKQQSREQMLSLVADELHALGYPRLQAKSVKPKHVEALVKHRNPGFTTCRLWRGEGDDSLCILSDDDERTVP